MNIVKKQFRCIIVIGISAISVSTSGQESNPYLSKWDGYDLSGNSLPVIMPYNRIIDPAGDQIYFGDKDLENHALDCALSPDNKTLAIEGRYRIVFYDVESGLKVKEVQNTTMQGQTQTQDALLKDYKDYNGLKFPTVRDASMMGQAVVFKLKEVKINEGVTDADFN